MDITPVRSAPPPIPEFMLQRPSSSIIATDWSSSAPTVPHPSFPTMTSMTSTPPLPSTTMTSTPLPPSLSHGTLYSEYQPLYPSPPYSAVPTSSQPQQPSSMYGLPLTPASFPIMTHGPPQLSQPQPQLMPPPHAMHSSLPAQAHSHMAPQHAPQSHSQHHHQPSPPAPHLASGAKGTSASTRVPPPPMPDYVREQHANLMAA